MKFLSLICALLLATVLVGCNSNSSSSSSSSTNSQDQVYVNNVYPDIS
ncbi:hypothetical protein MXE38_06380 [Anaerobiospirillum sp. NML120448]|nr:hypothetical protein [Anaerobiospirillum sp. NML120448]MCK0514480.1 hypothetical protein [Anaerobiospirillum sp. NML120448]